MTASDPTGSSAAGTPGPTALPPGELHITIRMETTEPVVVLEGELDLETAPKLQSVLGTILEEPSTTNVTLDMEGLEFIDSTGLRILVDAVSRLGDRGGKLAVRGARPATLKVLEICGLTQTMRVIGA
ncbi:MAG TPA: STAS domain-containing protein [Acidimicrobiales bacterium]|nr:STAS domain-containing protein [Acidimicrobiales bacterium]